MTLGYHPFAEIFPLIEGAAFVTFVEDIRENGIRDPIIIHDGAILDGRNRYRALIALRDKGELRGVGWGVYSQSPITDEDLDPAQGYNWFERYSVMLSGDPLKFVMSMNIQRRHLEKGQIAYAVAQYESFRHGGARRGEAVQDADLQVEKSADPQPETRAQLAHEHGVSERLIASAATVRDHGIEGLKSAVRGGDIAVSRAEEIARLPEEQQADEVARKIPNGARSIMSSRQEPDDSLDYFPTPPWATRALMQHVLPAVGLAGKRFTSVWEPACGEGHIAEVLAEYADEVIASDVFDHGYGKPEVDFLADGVEPDGGADWIVTNPPFGDKAIAFVQLALQRASGGVAMFMRSQWAVEGIERYETIFRDHPPTLCAFFVERVNLCKGRWEPEGSTATAYCWLVWRIGAKPLPTFWIPPGCREGLTRPDDTVRFTAHPVTRRAPPLDAEGHAIPHDGDGVLVEPSPAVVEERVPMVAPEPGNVVLQTQPSEYPDLPESLRRVPVASPRVVSQSTGAGDGG